VTGHDHDHDHHGHSHGHGHHHAAPTDFSTAFALGIVLNTAFVAIEAGYGWRIDSLALLADAAHNLSDVAALVLAWIASRIARRPASDRYTYGLRRASVLAALVNAVLLLLAMGSLAWEALGRFGQPLALQAGTVMAVAAVGIVINGATALLFLRGAHGDLNARGAYLHMASDAAVSAAVVVGAGLAAWQGWTWLDPVLSLGIAALIAVGTWALLRQSLHLLFDGVPDHIDLPAVRACLRGLPGVTGVSDLHIWSGDNRQVLLTAHLVLPEGDRDALLQQAAQALQAHFGIDHSTLQVTRQPGGSGCH
jgi:cobalt-zinc-cadmium efflux system protein